MDESEGIYENDLLHKKPADEHVQNLLQLVQMHESVLANIEVSTREAIAAAPESHYRPIRIAREPPERVLPFDLISTDNELLRKLLIVLSSNCDEINELKSIAETKFYPSLVMFGQQPTELATDAGRSTELLSGEREKLIGKFLPLLQELTNYSERCYAVAINMIQQISSLYSARQVIYRSTFVNVQLVSCFTALSKLLSVLVTLDTIIKGNEILLESWSYYKMMISYVRSDPSSFNTTDAGVTTFERMLVSIDQALMIGEIYKGCIEQNFETLDDGEEGGTITISIRNNTVFLNALLMSIKTSLDNALEKIGGNAELDEKLDVLGAFALYALYRRLLPPNVPPDPKLHKAFWGVQKTVPFVLLCDKYLWYPPEFLQSVAYLDIKHPEPANPANYRKQYMEKFDSAFPARSAAMFAQCTAWFILMESRLQASFRHETSATQALEIRSSILMKGLIIASRIGYHVKSCLAAHIAMEIPLTKTLLASITQLLNALKGIEFSYIRKDTVIAEAQTQTVRHYASQLLELYRSFGPKLQSIKKLDSGRADLLAAYQTFTNLLQSSEHFSSLRQSTLAILLEIIQGSPMSSEKESEKAKTLFKRLSLTCNLPMAIKRACDTSFLFFHTQLLNPMMSSIFSEPTAANRLQYVIGAFSDCVKLCRMVMHTDAAPFFINLRSFMQDELRSEIIERLCREIETDLRVHIHTKHLDHMQALNPKTENLRPLRPLLDLPPVRILGLLVHIKREVTHYLDTNFYNLTTVALHDWKTYAEMRSLAHEKLGLALMDSFLPMGGLDQGLDVLQIMRNIHVFVARFTYNMNMQEFVEFRPDKSSKHLNTIKIESIAGSIRQHGLGVLNTTVNFTYQFLAQKFHIFSQFLHDEYIRAHLSKEHRWFKKHKNDPDVANLYSFDRAGKFVKDIRKLGVNEHGKSFLDQFRIVITEIGNALGYVRMVRSASMHYCSEAVKFLPELDDTISFAHYSQNGMTLNPNSSDADPSSSGGEGQKLAEETIRAGRNLDDVIYTLIKNFGEGSDYFKVLVNVFQAVLLNEEHDGLKYFYAIVPSMCISWIDASVQAKEAMLKITRGASVREMYFTDDGFAMGVAYCLAILKQTKKYESLRWHESVKKRHKEESKKVADQQKLREQKQAAVKEKQKRKSSIVGQLGGLFSMGKKKEEEEDDTDEQDLEEFETLQLSAKKLEAQRREAEQLFYSMSGAGIFFRRTDISL